MDCNEISDQVLLYAASALSREEAEPVRRHLSSGCPRCAGVLAEAEATLALLAMTLPPATPPEELRRRLLERLKDENRPLPPLPEETVAPMRLVGNRPAAPWWAQVAFPSAIAAAVAAAITIFFGVRVQQNQAVEQQAQLQQVSASCLQLNQNMMMLTELLSRGAGPRPGSQVVQAMQWATDPNLKSIWLTGQKAQPAGAGARIFWDTDRNVWVFYASGLKPAEAGKKYELWYVTSDNLKIPAESFDADASGEAMLATTVPADVAGKISVAAVTDEPADKPTTQPTGSFQLVGNVPAK